MKNKKSGTAKTSHYYPHTITNELMTSNTAMKSSAEIRTLEEAAALDDRFILAWQKHPHFRIVENKGSFDDKLQDLLQQLRDFLEES